LPVTETTAPARVRGARRGLSRLAISGAAGALTAALLSRCGVAGLNHVAGWDVASMVFAGLGWARIVTMDSQVTRRRAAAEDPGRTFVWAVVLAASAFSLFAALVVMRNARQAGMGMQGLTVALCLLAVAMAWILTHTSYALRYAHLYYRDDEEGIGGLEFPNDAAPCYFDFAYFAFTVGMCFQVSDVTVSSSQIRRAVLGQALLAFIYNTTIVALVLNLVFALFN
jgi:uncharacterized membrane protein